MPAFEVEGRIAGTDTFFENLLAEVRLGSRHAALAGTAEQVMISNDSVHRRLEGFYCVVIKVVEAVCSRVADFGRIENQVASADAEVRLEGIDPADALRASRSRMSLRFDM